MVNKRSNQVREVWSEVKAAVHELRWALHQWPELGNQESRTTQVIQGFLLKHGVECKLFPETTGVVAFIDNQAAVTVGLRVDIDALPLQENTGHPHSSKRPGVMHACGHDMHASIGAGVAIMASRLRQCMPVNVKVIFQPAEECSPNGGARKMIALNVLEQPPVDYMLGLHVWPDYKVGEIGIRPGAIMAASDKFRIIITGVSAHAAQPHKGTDSILIASEIVNAIYKGIPRKVDPFDSYVLTIGEISSRGRYNVICDHVEMSGTIRTFNGATRTSIHKWLNDMVSQVAALHQGKAEVILERGYDVVSNDMALTAQFTDHAQEVLGAAAVKTGNQPSLIAEDFSAYSQMVPSVYFHLGCDCQYPLHSDRFLAQEEALDVGVELLMTFLLSSQAAKYQDVTLKDSYLKNACIRG